MFYFQSFEAPSVVMARLMCTSNVASSKSSTRGDFATSRDFLRQRRARKTERLRAVNDGAGDVDFVHYSIDPFAFSDTLIQVSPQAQRYIGQLELSDLGIASIDELNGQPFTFFVEDLPGAIVSSGAQFITRIINETPVALAPVNTIIQPPFTFEWEAFPVTYSFSYDIQIFQINFNIFTLVDEITGIPSSQTSVEYSRSLDRGEYFWVLFVIDEFGNKSRSVENPFTVP